MTIDPRLTGFGGIIDMLEKFGEYRKWPRFTLTTPDDNRLALSLLRNGKSAGSVTMEFTGQWMGYVHRDTGAWETTRMASNLGPKVKADLWQLMTDLRDKPKETFEEHVT